MGFVFLAFCTPSPPPPPPPLLLCDTPNCDTHAHNSVPHNIVTHTHTHTRCRTQHCVKHSSWWYRYALVWQLVTFATHLRGRRSTWWHRQHCTHDSVRHGYARVQYTLPLTPSSLPICLPSPPSSFLNSPSHFPHLLQTCWKKLTCGVIRWRRPPNHRGYDEQRCVHRNIGMYLPHPIQPIQGRCQRPKATV